jgi:hypothetical protein
MPRSQQSKSPIIQNKPSPPLVAHQSILEKPGFGQLIKEGIGFGAGQAIAHRTVSAILGSSIPVQTPEATNTIKCSAEKKAFEFCLKTKTQEDQCNNEFLAFTQCFQLK